MLEQEDLEWVLGVGQRSGCGDPETFGVLDSSQSAASRSDSDGCCPHPDACLVFIPYHCVPPSALAVLALEWCCATEQASWARHSAWAGAHTEGAAGTMQGSG